MIVGVRLDERLIHGQTLTNWIGLLGSTHVIVACDEVANDSLQVSALKMIVPSNLKTAIVTLEKAAQLLNDERSAKLKIFVLCRTPQDILKLCMHVPEIKAVNFAGYGLLMKTNTPNKKVIVPGYLLLDEDDEKVMKQIQNRGIECYCQVVPSQPKKQLEF
ncbi:PTS system mannose/fructose/N-acetylgalactosamine-transporter subunit IIB [Mediterraneibacter sp. ICN-202921]|uniref:PTS system mannose/fructose/N-acetylgalactosamine-transporter subunit IIB n=1 Tax=Mediterraneibacter sp. ICN-202921 TaxID=3134657 RepID=UPI0030C0919A